MRLIDADKLKVDIESFFADGIHIYDSFVELIDEQPTIEPEQRWIPCDEMLPEEDVDVLISYRYKEGEGDTSHVHIDITSYGDMYFGGNPVHDSVTGDRVKHWRQPFAYFTSNYEVVAWMPLPKPYREERDGNT